MSCSTLQSVVSSQRWLDFAAFHSDWLKFGSSLQRNLKFPKSSKSSSVLHLYFSLYQYRCFVGSSLALGLMLIAQHFLSFVSVVRSMPVQPSRASFLLLKDLSWKFQMKRNKKRYGERIQYSQ
jgi:hypothetical protein